MKDQCFKEDDILEKAIIGSFKIYEDSIFKPDRVLIDLAKRLFEEDTYKIKMSVDGIVTHHDSSLLMLFKGKKLNKIQEDLSRTFTAQGIEHRSGQRHCRITTTGSKLNMKDVEQKCYGIELKG